MQKKLSGIDITILEMSPSVKSYEFHYIDAHVIVVSNVSTRQLLITPEVIGCGVKTFLEPVTREILGWLNDKFSFCCVNVLNILRGGLNFPIEEGCFNNKIKLDAISFIASERIFIDNKVSRIETKYRKIATIEKSTLIMGDIIASGETLKNALDLAIEQYVLAHKTLERIIIFTIGTLHTLSVIAEYNRKLMQRWSKFKGIICVFYEGIFSTYLNNGVTGLNLPHVDFIVNGGFIAPEYRCALLGGHSTLFEKCIIYDGGARRFEISDHIKSILTYWERLSSLTLNVSISEFIKEKIGYINTIEYANWLNINNYTSLYKSSICESLQKAFEFEIINITRLLSYNLVDISKKRYKELQSYYGNYFNVAEN